METVVFDVDGVLTDGSFLYDDTSKAYKRFGTHDGDGLDMLKPHIDIRFISADMRGFGISKARVGHLGFELEYVKSEDRLRYMTDLGLETTIFVADGYHDVPALEAVAYSIAPRNARREALAVVDYVTESRGGEGAVLDACLRIIEKFFTITV